MKNEENITQRDGFVENFCSFEKPISRHNSVNNRLFRLFCRFLKDREIQHTSYFKNKGIRWGTLYLTFDGFSTCTVSCVHTKKTCIVECKTPEMLLQNLAKRAMLTPGWLKTIMAMPVVEKETKAEKLIPVKKLKDWSELDFINRNEPLYFRNRSGESPYWLNPEFCKPEIIEKYSQVPDDLSIA